MGSFCIRTVASSFHSTGPYSDGADWNLESLPRPSTLTRESL